MGSNPFQAWFFKALFSRLLKLSALLRWSLICYKCYSAVQINETSYIHFTFQKFVAKLPQWFATSTEWNPDITKCQGACVHLYSSLLLRGLFRAFSWCLDRFVLVRPFSPPPHPPPGSLCVGQFIQDEAVKAPPLAAGTSLYQDYTILQVQTLK